MKTESLAQSTPVSLLSLSGINLACLFCPRQFHYLVRKGHFSYSLCSGGKKLANLNLITQRMHGASCRMQQGRVESPGLRCQPLSTDVWHSALVSPVNPCPCLPSTFQVPEASPCWPSADPTHLSEPSATRVPLQSTPWALWLWEHPIHSSLPLITVSTHSHICDVWLPLG